MRTKNYMSKKGTIERCKEYLLYKKGTLDEFLNSFKLKKVSNAKTRLISSIDYYLENGDLSESEKAVLEKTKDKNETATKDFNLYCKKIILDVISFIKQGNQYNKVLPFEQLDYYLIYGSEISLEYLSYESEELRCLESDKDDIKITLEDRKLFCCFSDHNSLLTGMAEENLGDISLKNNVKSCSINDKAVSIPGEIQDIACTLISKLKIPRTYKLYRQLCKRILMFGEEYFDKYLKETENPRELIIEV